MPKPRRHMQIEQDYMPLYSFSLCFLLILVFGYPVLHSPFQPKNHPLIIDLPSWIICWSLQFFLSCPNKTWSRKYKSVHITASSSSDSFIFFFNSLKKRKTFSNLSLHISFSSLKYVSLIHNDFLSHSRIRPKLKPIINTNSSLLNLKLFDFNKIHISLSFLVSHWCNNNLWIIWVENLSLGRSKKWLKRDF